MRKYQRKLVKDVAYWYQSDSPLKWVVIAQKLGSPRPMTPREQKLLARMVVRFTKKAVKTATQVIRQFGITMQDATKSMRKFAEAIAEAKKVESEK